MEIALKPTQTECALDVRSDILASVHPGQLGITLRNPDHDCTEPSDQVAENWCARVAFERAERELFKEFEETLLFMVELDEARAASDKATRDRSGGLHDTFLQSQQAWTRYRDRHCKAIGYSDWTGASEDQLKYDCKVILAKRRVEELRQLRRTLG